MSDRIIISFPVSSADLRYFDEIAVKLSETGPRKVSRLAAIRYINALGRPLAEEQLGTDAQPGASFVAQCTTKEGLIATVSTLLARGFEAHATDAATPSAASV